MVTFEQLKNKEAKIAVVGLGYVGLPLAVLLAKQFDVIGFDVNSTKVAELQGGKDSMNEVEDAELAATTLDITDDVNKLDEAKVFILAIPTPVDATNTPDLKLLKKASEMVGQHLKEGSIVVYESTVYPGVTEEVCVPILEEVSGLKFGEQFSAGYSPERVNPGDKERTIDKIIKVVSGADAPTLDTLAQMYGEICLAGVHRAPSIKVAEAAKVIENAQRDLNIAFMNELSLIFHKVGIRTTDVLEAAGTKWNFLPFTPGLVGGHCIGVDPYYLTFRAKELGYEPEVILAGRAINDGMAQYVADEIMAWAKAQGVETPKVAMLGVTFKENVPDVRNSKAAELAQLLTKAGAQLVAYDPHADAAEVEHEYGFGLAQEADCAGADVVLAATAHDEFKQRGPEWVSGLLNETGMVVDIRNMWNPSDFPGKSYWSL